jgi:uncharacterized protein (UPF0248 family)
MGKQISFFLKILITNRALMYLCQDCRIEGFSLTHYVIVFIITNTNLPYHRVSNFPSFNESVNLRELQVTEGTQV